MGFNEPLVNPAASCLHTVCQAGTRKRKTERIDASNHSSKSQVEVTYSHLQVDTGAQVTNSVEILPISDIPIILNIKFVYLHLYFAKLHYKKSNLPVETN